MVALVFKGVAFAHGDAHPLFHDLTLRLDPGVYGVVGENGCGKTTLLRLASGDLAPDRGTVSVEPRGALVVVCPQTVDDLGEDVRAFAEDMAGEALALRDVLGLRPEMVNRWDTLSPGERRRFQLAAALHLRPDVLLCDEPTNHLDRDARERMGRALRRFRGVALVVSHDRALLDEMSTGTLRVHGARVTAYDLPYSRARAAWESEARARETERAEKKEALAAATGRLREAESRRAGADHQRIAGRRMKDRHDSDAKDGLANFRVSRAEKNLGRLVGARKSDVARAAEAIPAFEGTRQLGRSVFVGYEAAPRAHVLRLDGVRVMAGATLVLRAARVTVGPHARVHIAGPNGAGKSTLVRALVEASTLPAGRLLYLPQEMSQKEAQRLLADVRALPPEDRGRTLSLVAALGVDPDRLLASKAPSPGEARKLAMARGLGQRAWAAVLDEPTNHLDLPSIERLEAALAAFPGALVVVSHDERFASRLTDERWSLCDGEIRTESVAGESVTDSG
ncbi:MAG: ATP-binding cassette domain-containing protein [Polyangiaceae bacterium]